ncbi:MAG TPA: hypothetical protein EYP65_06590 [Armatimonadetes bacterium]|nr:hypothetical protein [Armatimonadota bacterium]
MGALGGRPVGGIVKEVCSPSRVYIFGRYSNALPSGSPGRRFTKGEAERMGGICGGDRQVL